MSRSANTLVTAVYSGTFDPLTLGHEDAIRRAAKMFDRVIIAVAVAHHKKTLFSLDERVALAQAALADCPNVKALPFEGLIVEFVRAQNAQVIVRGLRAVSDFEYEFQMAGMNRRLYPEVETVFLTPGERHMFVSATMVREIARLGGDVSSFVSPHVNACFVARGWGKPSP